MVFFFTIRDSRILFLLYSSSAERKELVGDVSAAFLAKRGSLSLVHAVFTEGMGNAIQRVHQLPGGPVSRQEIDANYQDGVKRVHEAVLEKHRGLPFSICFDEGDGETSKRGTCRLQRQSG